VQPIQKSKKVDNGHGEAASLAARQRRCRQRRKSGIMVVPVEVDGPVLDLLIKMGVIKEEHAGSPASVGRSIGEMLARSARL
jgi:hypothetical protein